MGPQVEDKEVIKLTLMSENDDKWEDDSEENEVMITQNWPTKSKKKTSPEEIEETFWTTAIQVFFPFPIFFSQKCFFHANPDKVELEF